MSSHTKFVAMGCAFLALGAFEVATGHVAFVAFAGLGVIFLAVARRYRRKQASVD